jgi:replicative DNA helicase
MNDTAVRAGESVLGCLLAFYKPELVTVIQARGVVWSDFPHERQRVVYRAVLALHRDGVHVDDLTVEAFLASHGQLERAGGPGFLAVCAASASPGALKDHAWLVAEGARWTRLASACESLGRAVEHQDDVALREAVSLVKRDVLEGAPPKLHVVKDAVA